MFSEAVSKIALCPNLTWVQRCGRIESFWTQGDGNVSDTIIAVKVMTVSKRIVNQLEHIPWGNKLDGWTPLAWVSPVALDCGWHSRPFIIEQEGVYALTVCQEWEVVVDAMPQAYREAPQAFI